MMQRHSRLRKQRAQALAEMAVMVPFLVIGMMGMLDLGRAFYYQISLTNAVREGARFAAAPSYQGLYPACITTPPTGPNCPSPSDGDIQYRVNRELLNTQITGAVVTVTPNEVQRVNYYNAGTPTTGYEINVSATYKFSFITPIISNLIGDSNGQLTIKTGASFRSEY